MSDFSIELSMERIVDHRSRAYFREVFTSYAAGNFRSATVMLWSVVVCDILFKLDEMRMTHADPTAESLLAEVEKIRIQKPNSPEWEEFLLREIKKRTLLLEEHEFRAMDELQKHRHLAAHPILTSGYELIAPTPEATRADIRSALECVLTKPPLMTKKVFAALVEDLESKKDLFAETESLQRYLAAKFLSGLLPSVAREVFKSLWNVSFRSEDPRAEANRDINARALGCIYDRSPLLWLEVIDRERPKFSSINTTAMPFLCGFLAPRSAVFEKLTDEAKTVIHQFQKANPLCLLAGFAAPGGFGGQIRQLTATAREIAWQELELTTFISWLALMEQRQLRNEVRAMLIAAHVGSTSYDEANVTFDLLRMVIDGATPGDFLALFAGIENNNQAFGRNRSTRDLRGLREAAEAALGPGFDYSPYPRVAAKIAPPPPVPDDEMPF